MRPRKKQEHAKLVKAIIECLQWDGWGAVPIRAGPFSQKGIWDVYADKLEKAKSKEPVVPQLHRPRVIWIEAKVGDDGLSEDQEDFGGKRRENGVETYVIREPEDLHRFRILSKRVKINV